MRILLSSDEGDGAWFALRLLEEGHQVDYYLCKSSFCGILEGIVPEPMFEEPDYASYDLVLFDDTEKPNKAERSAQLCPTIGNSLLAKEMEDNRLFGIQIMEESGIEVPPYEHFTKVENAKRYIKAHPNRYVFKPFSLKDQSSATTYVSKDPEDLLQYIDCLEEETQGAEFILQEFEDGIEISTEGWFNGEDFYLINSTLEEKKFLDGNLGPNTGCAGNLVWTYNHEPRIYTHGLKKIIPFLQEHNYVGMVDLNTIASDSHLYGLEWTPRLGYDAACCLFALYGGNLGEFFYDIATGGKPLIETKLDHNFAASVRVSIPPYPNLKAKNCFKENVPIRGLTEEDIPYMYLQDVKCDGENFYTAGYGGFIGCPIVAAATIESVYTTVKDKIEKLRVPDLQYRTDLHHRSRDRYDAVNMQGWLRR